MFKMKRIMTQFQLRIKQVLLILGILIFIVFTNQNCSKVAFDGNNKNASVTKSDLGISDDPSQPKQPHNNNEEEDEDNGRIEERNNQNDDCSNDEDEDGQLDEKWLKKYCFNFEPNEAPSISSDVGNSQLQNVFGSSPVFIEEAFNVLLQHVRTKVIIEKAFRTTVLDSRGPLLIRSVEINSIENSRGPLCLQSHSVQKLIDHRGPILFNGLSKNGKKSKIELIENFRGPIILRNVDVEKIINHRGPIYIENGSIHERIDTRGPLFQN